MGQLANVIDWPKNALTVAAFSQRTLHPKGCLADRNISGQAGKYARQAIGQVIGPLTCTFAVTCRPGYSLIIKIFTPKVPPSVAYRECRSSLLIQHISRLSVLANELALGTGHICKCGPGTVIQTVTVRIAGEVLGWRGACAHTEDGLLGASGHENVLVSPVGNINKIDLFRIVLPTWCQRDTVCAAIAFVQRTGRAVDGLVQLPVGVTELVQRHVTGTVINRPLLCVTELTEFFVGAERRVAGHAIH